jgi:hypothetical protein
MDRRRLDDKQEVFFFPFRAHGLEPEAAQSVPQLWPLGPSGIVRRGVFERPDLEHPHTVFDPFVFL